MVQWPRRVGSALQIGPCATPLEVENIDRLRKLGWIFAGRTLITVRASTNRALSALTNSDLAINRTACVSKLPHG
jgi:hypothetical protein